MNRIRRWFPSVSRALPYVSRATFVSSARSIRGRYSRISGNKPYLTGTVLPFLFSEYKRCSCFHLFYFCSFSDHVPFASVPPKPLSAMITGGSILSISDFTAQTVSSRFIDNYRFDTQRTLALCLFGTFYYGLVMRKLYFVYETAFGPGRPLFKAMIDCTVHTPFLLLPCFYAMTGAVKGQRPMEIYEQFKAEWWTSSTASIAYWLPVMLFNFRYCTPQTRILFISSTSWVQKTALSWYSNRSRVEQRAQQEYELQLELQQEYEVQLELQLVNPVEELNVNGISLSVWVTVLECWQYSAKEGLIRLILQKWPCVPSDGLFELFYF